MDAITTNAEQPYYYLADLMYKFREIGKLPLKVRVGKLKCFKTLREP